MFFTATYPIPRESRDQREKETRDFLLTAEAELDRIQEDEGRRLEGAAIDLRETLGVAEGALQVRAVRSAKPEAHGSAFALSNCVTYCPVLFQQCFEAHVRKLPGQIHTGSGVLSSTLNDLLARWNAC